MDNWNNNQNYENYQNNQNYQQQYVPDYNYGYSQPLPEKPVKIVTPSAVFGLISGILLIIGLFLPMIDFSHFHEEVHIEYNLFKIAENVGLISSMWVAIPYGILIGAIGLIILSFVRVAIFKILPLLLVLAMLVLMLVDMGNVVEWVNDLLLKFNIDTALQTEVSVKEIFSSFMAGFYLIVAGVVSGIISCFVKAE